MINKGLFIQNSEHGVQKDVTLQRNREPYK